MPEDPEAGVAVQPSPPAEPEVTEEPQPSAGAEPETPPEPSAEGGEQPPRKGGVQRRIDELTRKTRLAESEAEFWKQKAMAPGEKAPATDIETPQPEPNAAEFETTETYLKAYGAWVKAEALREARVEIRAELQKNKQELEQRSQRRLLASEWSEREAEAETRHSDYEEVVSVAMDTLQTSQGPGQAAVAHALQFSEAGPEVLYYLGQHPEEVSRLSRLHPTQAVIALGRIEARLAEDNSGGEGKPPPATRAPKPPTPIRKTAPATTLDPTNSADAEKMTPDEWARAMAERERKLRGR